MGISANVLAITKFAVSGVVGLGAGKIVAKVIKDHVNPETLVDKISMTAGAWAIGGMVSKATKQYTDEYIDGVAKNVTKQVDRFKESAKLGRIDRKESTFEKEELDPAEYIQAKSTGHWVNAKQYAKSRLARFNKPELNAGDSFDINQLETRGVITKVDGKWEVVEDDADDVITLRKNDEGVWEETRTSVKS